MYSDVVSQAVETGKKKLNLLKTNPVGYFIASMLAGIYVGFGIILIFTVGGQISPAPYTKLIMGACFGIALSLVLLAGADLFTGNIMLMTFGVKRKEVSAKDAVRLLITCWFGNWAGSFLLALAFWLSGYAVGDVETFIAHSAMVKMSLPIVQLFLRGVLCNILVCLAVWCSVKCKSESGKLIMIFWCLFAFITSGYEHSIANMTLLSISLLEPMQEAITLGKYFYNILVVTCGNIVGGMFFVALPYYIIGKEK